MRSTFVELHILQNFAPSCLNRDDTNAPKDCIFGGVRRARISSQCLKRSVRRHPSFQEPLHGALGTRTKALLQLLEERLREAWGAEAPDDIRGPLEVLVRQLGLGLKVGKTEYLLFLGNDTVTELAGAAREHWEALAAVATGAAGGPTDDEGKSKKRSGRKQATQGISKEVQERLTSAFKGGSRAVDVALFGRMVATLAEMNVDAACQVAHAFSTNEVQMEMDFYTAVDDLQSKDETGAGMMGMVEFNSACFYRYSLIDWHKLVENLRGDYELAQKAVIAYLGATVRAIPTGKQSSMAAHNPPGFVYTSVRHGGMPRSLADAFIKPVRPRRTEDLVAASIATLTTYRDRLNAVYGDDDALEAAFAVDPEANLNGLSSARVAGLSELLRRIEEHLAPAGEATRS